MSLGNKLLNLRKSKNLSQEEVADKLDVSRQTVSKWETDLSTPDFDKIVPLCNLYGITPDELLLENKVTNRVINEYPSLDDNERKLKRAKGISLGVLLFFVAICWIMISVPVIRMNPVVAAAIFLLICGFATFSIVYVSIMYHKEKVKEKINNVEDENYLRHIIEKIVAIFVVIIYLIVSFTTMAWHLTWIIWVVYGLFAEILKLVFMLRGMKDEK